MRRMSIAFAFALTAAPAAAQTAVGSDSGTVLPDRVVTATGVPTLIQQIPAGVTVIDRATIAARGYTTLADALSEVPGVHVVQSGGQGGVASVFIRGTDSNHVLVLRDGVPVNDPSDPGDAFNFGVDTLGDVDRIEVIRGPMSSLYGSGAIGGVINIITPHGEGKPVENFEFAAGVPRALRASAGASGKVGKFDYNLFAQTQSDLGFDTTPQRESVQTGSRNSYRNNNGNIEFGFTPIEGTRFSAALSGREAYFNLDELGSPAYDPTGYKATDDAAQGRVGVTSTMFGGVYDTSLFLARSQSNRRYNEPLEAADPNQAFGNNSYFGARNSVLWNNTVHLPDLGPAALSALTFGYTFNADTARSTIDSSSSGFLYQSSLNARETENAGHVGLQSTLWNRLTLTGDMREDAATYGGAAFTWRLGGVLAVPEIWSRFKLAYGTAFKAPSLFDLFGVDGFGFVGNPNLHPERSAGWETGWAVDVPILGNAQAMTVDVTYFNNRIHDLIQIVYSPDFTSSTPQNVDLAQTYGVESSLTFRPAPWLNGTLSFTQTEAHDVLTGARLLRRPQQTASGSLNIKPIPNLSIVPQLVYTGGFVDFLTDNNGFPAGIGPSKAGLLFNLSVNYALDPKVTLFATGTNLTNSRFEPANGYQTPGAQLLMGLRVHL